VNLSLGQFVEKLSYKLGQHSIKLTVANDSYTSKASFVVSLKMPLKYDLKAKPSYSGIFRSLYLINQLFISFHKNDTRNDEKT